MKMRGPAKTTKHEPDFRPENLSVASTLFLKYTFVPGIFPLLSFLPNLLVSQCYFTTTVYTHTTTEQGPHFLFKNPCFHSSF